MFRPASHTRAAAFCGIHVFSPRIFSLMNEDGVFPIVPVYLRLAGEGERIFGFSADAYYWRDLGRRESLEQAGRDLKNNIVSD
jgi:NDP-sugar pyrophosphorylase family protein